VVQWTDIAEYTEPDWERLGDSAPPALFWRPKKGATYGYIRDGELFDAKWIYVSDANKVSHFCDVEGPSDGNVVDLAAHRAG
jgi:hypothetical protein